ncbi:outer membrane protein [Phreatobacter cathodiphilus]|uniref:Porin family protein n=1 Tax=Phreatobacter cathodiphilus TaxID=1868589 RepID=A0A2S0NBS1_9HYPH|nr:outer membrane beta-barrel protein [Phreatobacter cathodiphilus]AVO45575.1 porin family protein [Phreatobacter cathodiphilus]
MRRPSTAVLAAAAALAATAATAADMPPVLRQSQPVVQPAESGGWYLRGDIGVAGHSIGNFGVLQNGSQVRVGTGGVNDYQLRMKSHSETVSIGLGAGYQFNSWFRVDVTGEYRAGGRLRGMDYVNFDQSGGTTSQTNLYNGGTRSIVGLANFYVDLGTFCQIGCLTPYVGAGFGFAHTTVSNFTDTSTGFNSVTGATGSLGGYATTASRTSFAWALMAGVGYKVNERLTLEAGYRYLSLGDLPALLLRDPATGLPRAGNETVQVSRLTAHEIKIGMRWSLNCSCAVPSEPIVARY